MADELKAVTKIVSIQEGRTARNFANVGRLVTKDPAGNSTNWYPEDACYATEDDGYIESFTENGEYSPDPTKGKFFSKVQVSVQGGGNGMAFNFTQKKLGLGKTLITSDQFSFTKYEKEGA